MNASTSPVTDARNWAERQKAEYAGGEDRPLGGYVAVMGTYALSTLAGSALARKLGRPAPARLSPWEVAQLGIATHKISRLVSKDPVTSPVRAPFTRYEGVSAPSELAEEVRGHGTFRHSLGELLTCPMCLAQWVATGLSVGLALAPNATRAAMSTFTAVAASDFLQHLYVRLQQATE
jgi:Protein of unknown function (DUF1360)